MMPRYMTPQHPIPRLDRIPQHIRDYNGRLCGLLLSAIPERIKSAVIAEMSSSGETYHELPAVAIFDELYHNVSLGGIAEVEGLTSFSQPRHC